MKRLTIVEGISTCAECRHCYEPITGPIECLHDACTRTLDKDSGTVQGPSVGNADTIPSWCPLPDIQA